MEILEKIPSPIYILGIYNKNKYNSLDVKTFKIIEWVKNHPTYSLMYDNELNLLTYSLDDTYFVLSLNTKNTETKSLRQVVLVLRDLIHYSLNIAPDYFSYQAYKKVEQSLTKSHLRTQYRKLD